jgi:phytanoyl-CoA hydroxylase
LSGEKAESINREIEDMLKTGKATFRYGNKIMFAIHKSLLLREIGNQNELKELLSVLLNGEAVLFQSINFLTGSEQATHSDSIHMTTYPLGGLLGVWIALEDIDENNGPLHYYPGSHKLPYYLNSDYDNEGNFFLIGDKSYTAYEEMIERKIGELGLKKEIFTAKKGDLLIWHANLFHGGEPHLDKNRTRKSLVYHYFNKKAICYHEITQRPALIKHIED